MIFFAGNFKPEIHLKTRRERGGATPWDCSGFPPKLPPDFREKPTKALWFSVLRIMETAAHHRVPQSR